MIEHKFNKQIKLKKLLYQQIYGMMSTSDNVTISNVASGTYNGISNSDINGTYFSAIFKEEVY